ncbi:hypothetical protein BJ138DRAFT_1150559 [Hygrophoropsis aurantiaca]|uniref:Uncharacterized protein n=1 Tax=Hygrophoropsis aurantiaca TaxID=72124 RepID=A0ACB8AEB7_9AGAM|nr:hypothetical protein BJ138DRAFT_1150559 [Hygrophoropsis aurantiaca]
MEAILKNPGLIKIEHGSERLRKMFRDQMYHLNYNLFSDFAKVCFSGCILDVKKAILDGIAPDIAGTETPWKIGYASLIVLGAQRVKGPVTANSLQHSAVMLYLIQSGMPPNIPDIVGHSALHHACNAPSRPDLARILLQNGGNPNQQTRYGEVALFFTMQNKNTAVLEMLLENGARLDVCDANGDSPGSMFLSYGPEVTAVVTRIERQRAGTEAPPLDDNTKCENCQKRGTGKTKQCGRCRTVRYCSPECQRAHWKTHKLRCIPFSTVNVITVKPTYGGIYGYTTSRSDFARQCLDIPVEPGNEPRRHRNADKNAKKAKNEVNKSMIIKVQVPVGMFDRPALETHGQGLLVYNRKRDFVCGIEKASNPAHYDDLVGTVLRKGVKSVKAYFSAELKNRDELVIKISEVLAEQPF